MVWKNLMGSPKARMAQLVRALDSETCDSWAEHGSNPATVKGLS